MSFRNLIIIIFIIAIGIADHAEAQSGNKYKKRKQFNKESTSYSGDIRILRRFTYYKYIGLSINALNYFGDLAPVNKFASTDISFTRPGFGIYGGYRFHPSLAIRASLNYGRLFGDDIVSNVEDGSGGARYDRNLSFRNDIKEFQIGVEIYALPNPFGPNQRLPFNAYLFLGGAVFHHEPKGLVPDADYQIDITGSTPAPQAGQWVKLRPLGTEGQNIDGLGVAPYKSIQVSIPIAVGANFRIPNSNLNAGLEFGLRYLFFDYLDDVSGTYVDLDMFDSDIARILSDRSVELTGAVSGQTRSPLNTIQTASSSGTNYNISGLTGSGTTGVTRGNPQKNDLIFMTQIKLTYIFNATGGQNAKFR